MSGSSSTCICDSDAMGSSPAGRSGGCDASPVPLDVSAAEERESRNALDSRSSPSVYSDDSAGRVKSFDDVAWAGALDSRSLDLDRSCDPEWLGSELLRLLWQLPLRLSRELLFLLRPKIFLIEPFINQRTEPMPYAIDRYPPVRVRIRIRIHSKCCTRRSAEIYEIVREGRLIKPQMNRCCNAKQASKLVLPVPMQGMKKPMRTRFGSPCDYLLNSVAHH
jgi:hypothetical protein